MRPAGQKLRARRRDETLVRNAPRALLRCGLKRRGSDAENEKSRTLYSIAKLPSRPILLAELGQQSLPASTYSNEYDDRGQNISSRRLPSIMPGVAALKYSASKLHIYCETEWRDAYLRRCD